MIFTARQLQEKCQEQNVDLYMTYVDLTKAFDTSVVMGAKFRCPPRFIAMFSAMLTDAFQDVDAGFPI